MKSVSAWKRVGRSVALAGAGAVVLAVALSGCSGLSEREEAMVGKYYIPEASNTYPSLELNGDRSATIRAMKRGEARFAVRGEWRLEGDTLVIDNDASSITIEDGDPAFVGRIADRVAWPVVRFNETTLCVRRQGIEYDYRRRAE